MKCNEMKNRVLFIILILFTNSCDNKNNAINEIKRIIVEVQQELTDDRFKVVSIKNNKKSILIELSINHNFIVHQNHQLILIQRILYKIGMNGNIDRPILFRYYLDNESDNITETTYSQNDIIEWLEFYNENIFFSKVHQLVLKSFSATSIFALNIWLEKAHDRYKDQIPQFSFLELLYKLNNECNNKGENKKAKIAVVVSYVAIDDYIKNGQLLSSSIPNQNDNLIFLKSLWKYCNDGEDISIAEKRLFGKVGGNWETITLD